MVGVAVEFPRQLVVEIDELGAGGLVPVAPHLRIETVVGLPGQAPLLSPKKTWEGSAGSLVLSVAVGIAMSVFVLDAPWYVGLVLGVVMVLFGTAGDLLESTIKRDVGIKDMSSILPGHGGVMDRLDSMLVAAPAAWLVLFLMVPGG